MLKIGEFSKLSRTTVKALRFYEKEGLLIPAFVDERTGYRFYETAQLDTAAKIRSYRQLGLSVGEIRSIFSGGDVRAILSRKAAELRREMRDTVLRLSVIDFILEEKEMKYQVTVKDIAEMTVYVSETVLAKSSDLMAWVPSVGEECLRLNPGMKCAEVPYEFCEYPDGEYKEENVRVRHVEAVTSVGKENERIRFAVLPAARVLSIYHKGAYDSIGEAYAYIMQYAEQNGYEVAGLARESYIDGIWNKESVEDWLTEIQLPVK